MRWRMALLLCAASRQDVCPTPVRSRAPSLARRPAWPLLIGARWSTPPHHRHACGHEQHALAGAQAAEHLDTAVRRHALARGDRAQLRGAARACDAQGLKELCPSRTTAASDTSTRVRSPAGIAMRANRPAYSLGSAGKRTFTSSVRAPGSARRARSRRRHRPRAARATAPRPRACARARDSPRPARLSHTHTLARSTVGS